MRNKCLCVSISLKSFVYMHNKYMHAHCPRMLVWCCGLLLLTAMTAINVCAVCVNLSCKCLQSRNIFDGSYKIYAYDTLACFKFKSSCTVYLANRPLN